MKKNVIFIYTITLILGVLGCTKDLDLTPQNALSDESFWKTEKDFELAANDYYIHLDDHVFENFADLTYGADGPNSISNGSYLVPESDNRWENAYELIRSTTYLITKAEDSPAKDNVQRYVGEARFFRALAYYRLVKTFGDVPLITKVLDLDSEEVFATRTERTEVIDFILKDLDLAATVLPKRSALQNSELSRITNGAALALKARVALFEGTWQKYHGTNNNVDEYLTAAINAASIVINSNEYELYTDDEMPELSFTRLFDFYGDDSKEVILSHRHESDNHGTDYSHWLAKGYGITKKLADMFLCTDGLPIDKSPKFAGYATLTSEFIDRDPRMSGTILPPGTPFIIRNGVNFAGLDGGPYFEILTANKVGYIYRKSQTEDVQGLINVGTEKHDYKMIRYAEVLLIYAEATFEKNGFISDDDLNKSINVLRDRAGVNMIHLTNNHVNSNGLDMLTEIRRERIVELALEGQRLDDLKRWKTAEVEMPKAIKGVKFQGTEYESMYTNLEIGKDVFVDDDGFLVAEASGDRNFEQKDYLFPLPQVELQLNKNLEQNPGW
jgi:hypothetical protein